MSLFSQFQEARLRVKLLKIFLCIPTLYLLLPPLINSADWALTGPPPPPLLEPISPLQNQTSLQYCKLTLNPELPSEAFQARLAPFLDSATLKIPYNNPEVLETLFPPKNHITKDWHLYLPNGNTLTHTQTLLRNLPEKSPEDQTETLLFLLKLGNQLTNIPIEPNFQLGLEILKNTLIPTARSPAALKNPKIQIELSEIQNLPEKDQKTQQREKILKTIALTNELWTSDGKPTVMTPLLNRKFLEQSPTHHSLEEQNRQKTQFLLTGQLFHLHLLQIQDPPQNLEQTPKQTSGNNDLPHRLSKLATLLLQGNHARLDKSQPPTKTTP